MVLRPIMNDNSDKKHCQADTDNGGEQLSTTTNTIDGVTVWQDGSRIRHMRLIIIQSQHNRIRLVLLYRGY